LEQLIIRLARENRDWGYNRIQDKRMFPSWRREQKEAWIYEQITQIVLTAKANRCVVVLEYLDFEGCKRWLRTKLGAMLRIMPYRKIRKVFERRCMEQGVVLRYVKSHYTSILGGGVELLS